MKTIKQFSIALLIFGTTFIVGCTKDDQEGCTDVGAINYSADAKKDNSTCLFEGSAVLWVNQTSSQNMVNDGIQLLTFYIGEKIIGNQSASAYHTEAPNCGQQGVITYALSFSRNAKNGTASYRVVDQNNVEIWSGTIVLNANTCEKLELVY